MSTLSHSIGNLSVQEKLDLIAQLWDSIPEHQQVAIPLTPAQEECLNAQLKLLDEGKLVTYTWEEVKADLMKRFGRVS